MLTWQYRDRSDWKYPNVDAAEPDKAHWAASGFDCLIVRGPSGALCGYVGVPAGHPWFEKEHDDVDVSVHGGLTFSAHCAPSDEPERHICHQDEFAVNKTVWWLGFDCAHCFDICPSYERGFSYESSYKDFDYVQIETENLARQLRELADRAE